ncbi:calumenin-like isoform X2 [Haliotis rufescens]|uniref:calumenin-like isoform X2 n=1 Tax=Haliotis rufescens TaxID=6454 RepID=UPI00201EDBE7|nr:calumenin-like isoform X2 [Haliotis rufescens]
MEFRPLSCRCCKPIRNRQLATTTTSGYFEFVNASSERVLRETERKLPSCFVSRRPNYCCIIVMMKCLVCVLSLCVALTVVLAVKEAHAPHDPLGGEKEIDGERNKHRDHEAVLGSRHDAEEADELSSERAKELLEKLATKHDLDGDKRISKDEFITWILQSFKSLDAEEALERFKEEDVNHDNIIGWDEYLKQQYDYSLEDMKKMRAQPDEDDNKNMVEMVDEDERRFNGADLDKSGSLDKSEYVAFYHPYDFEHMHQYEIERGIKDYDKDGDGQVSMKEFVGDVDDMESRTTEETQFKGYDKNGDGFLQGSELKKWLVQDNMDSAVEEVDHLMDVADGDKDGFLTFPEIREHQEEFVSSQATDYGTTLEKMRDEL